MKYKYLSNNSHVVQAPLGGFMDPRVLEGGNRTLCVYLSPAGSLSSSAPSRPVWIWAASHAFPVCPCSLARGHCPVISPESQNFGAGRGLGAHWFSPVFSSQSYWGLQRKDASSGINTHSHEPYGWKPCVFVSVPKQKREAWDFLEVYFSW